MSARTDITEGLAARVLLDHARAADMLVLGPPPTIRTRTAGPDPSSGRAAAAPCPVVIIGPAAPDPGDHVPESWQRSQSYLATAR